MNKKPSHSQAKRISEAADELGLKPHVLRYWETEFTQIQPIRTRSGQRLYTSEHIALLRHIQDLLHIQGMTIDGAKRILNASIGSGQRPATEHHYNEEGFLEEQKPNQTQSMNRAQALPHAQSLSFPFQGVQTVYLGEASPSPTQENIKETSQAQSQSSQDNLSKQKENRAALMPMLHDMYAELIAIQCLLNPSWNKPTNRNDKP